MGLVFRSRLWVLICLLIRQLSPDLLFLSALPSLHMLYGPYKFRYIFFPVDFPSAVYGVA